jgi:hypothetical protein
MAAATARRERETNVRARVREDASPPTVLASSRFSTLKPRLVYTPGTIGGAVISRVTR